MSDTKNHKKAIAITRSCRKNRGLITDIYYKILEDHPAAIVNAFEALRSKPAIPGDFHDLVEKRRTARTAPIDLNETRSVCQKCTIHLSLDELKYCNHCHSCGHKIKQS